MQNYETAVRPHILGPGNRGKTMRIVYESDLFIPPVLNAISILTNGAKVCIEDIHYDRARGTVDIHMHRKELLECKKTVLGETKPVYGQSMIRSLLTIRQVEAMNLKVDDRLVAECNSCFTVLLGLAAEDQQLYLGSAEEIRGHTLCEIFIKVKQMNIEFIDEINSGSAQ
jgi:hypothetical protein